MTRFPCWQYRIGEGGSVESRLFQEGPIPSGWFEDKFKARAAVNEPAAAPAAATAPAPAPSPEVAAAPIPAETGAEPVEVKPIPRKRGRPRKQRN